MGTGHPYQSLDIDERVKRVLARTPLIDGHNDLPQQPRAIFHGKIHNNEKFDLNKGFQRGMTDIPRLREGQWFPNNDSLMQLVLTDHQAQ